MASISMVASSRHGVNSSTEKLTSRHYGADAEHMHNAGMAAPLDERARLCNALRKFWEDNKAGMQSISEWARASDIAYNTLYEVIGNLKEKKMSDESYEKLSKGATALLGRDVTVDELKGIPPDTISRIIGYLKQLPPKEQAWWESMIESRAKMHRDDS